MNNSASILIIGIMWIVFACLIYFSVLAPELKQNGKKLKGKKKSASKSNFFPLTLCALAAVLLVRILLAAQGKLLSDLVSQPAMNYFALLGSEGQDALTAIMLKLPSILADLCSALLLYLMASKHGQSPQFSFCISLLFALNPYNVWATSSYVQLTSLAFLLIVLSFDFLLQKKYLLSGIFFGLSFLIHGYALYLLPLYILFVLMSIKADSEKFGFSSLLGFLPVLVGAIAAACIDNLVIAPFIRNDLPAHATNNAFNWYALINSNGAELNKRLFYLNPAIWGIILLILTVFFTGLMFWKSQKKESIFFFSGLTVLSVLCFVSEAEPLMFVPIVLLFLLDYVLRPERNTLLTAGILSLAGLLNLGQVATQCNDSILATTVPSSDWCSIVTGILLLAGTLFAYYTGYTKYLANTEHPFVYRPLSDEGSRKMVRIDWLILAGFVLVGTVLNFYQLGDTKAAQHPWNTANGVETVVDLGESHEPITKWCYYLGLGEKDKLFTLETSPDGQTWTQVTSEKTVYCFTWYDKGVTITDRYARIISEATDLEVIEMGFFSGGSTNYKLVPVTVISGDDGAFDEQDLVPYDKTYMNSMYFDEIYHGRTAYENVHDISPYEWTHPPLGKLIMSVAVRIFGMTPFGWRFAGTLFGVLMIPLVYLFGKKVFRKTWLASLVTFLTVFDCMHFAQTRIATIDSFGVFFIILMYYFMYDFYTMDFRNATRAKMWTPLLLSGISFGLGCAAKWIGVYAGGGLAVLFFLAIYRCSKERKRDAGSMVTSTILMCVLFFGVIPAAIYYASYMPILKLYDRPVAQFFAYQKGMYDYHKGVTQAHGFSSPWYSWPLMLRPVWYFSGGGNASAQASSIVGMGNPFIWWLLIPSFVFMIFLLTKKVKDNRIWFFIIAFLSQYIPWMSIGRTVFLYHFYASIPFLTLMLVYALGWLWEHKNAKALVIGYLVLVLISFFMYLPVISGLPVNKEFVNTVLKAFDSWVLC